LYLPGETALFDPRPGRTLPFSGDAEILKIEFAHLLDLLA
jgi:hypothetical protein